MRRFFIVASVFAIAGCSQAVDVRQQFDAGTDFDEYKTFSWVHGEVPVAEKHDWENALRDELSSDLQSKGMKYTPSNPDIWIDYQFGLQTVPGNLELDKHTLEQARNSEVYSSEGGILVVDFIDAAQDKLVWRGIARGAVNVDPSEEIMRKNVTHAVKKLMKQYPPSLRPTGGY